MGYFGEVDQLVIVVVDWIDYYVGLEVIVVFVYLLVFFFEMFFVFGGGQVVGWFVGFVVFGGVEVGEVLVDYFFWQVVFDLLGVEVLVGDLFVVVEYVDGVVGNVLYQQVELFLVVLQCFFGCVFFVEVVDQLGEVE